MEYQHVQMFKNYSDRWKMIRMHAHCHPNTENTKVSIWLNAHKPDNLQSHLQYIHANHNSQCSFKHYSVPAETNTWKFDVSSFGPSYIHLMRCVQCVS